MSGDRTNYELGNIGESSTVQIGEHLTNISVQVKDAREAEALLRRLREELGERPLYGPAERTLTPLVLVNRAVELASIHSFFQHPAAHILYILGLPGVGKSTLARGALEFCRQEVQTVWVTCKGLDATQLLVQLNTGLQLKAQALLRDMNAKISQQIPAVLGVINRPSIVVLDGFEALLDNDGQYSSQDMADVIKALTEMDHKAKVLVTTRLLPNAALRGGIGNEVLRLSGLDWVHARELFRARAELTAEEAMDTLPDEALIRLEGNPQFIELLVGAMTELPAQEVVEELLEATEIGEYVLRQVLSQLSSDEMQLLRAALVFRGVFSYEALRIVYSALGGREKGMVKSVQTMVRRSIFELGSRSEKAYYFHSLIRDAVPRDTSEEAMAHAAAAAWFLKTPIAPMDPTTWDNGLYHLHQAAIVGRDQEHFQVYYDFVDKHTQALTYAGFIRRIIDEYRILDELSLSLGTYDVYLRKILAVNLWEVGERQAAFDILRDIYWRLVELHRQEPEQITSATAKEFAQVSLLLADSLVENGQLEEARDLAKDVNPDNEALSDRELAKSYALLKYRLARAEEHREEMLRQATKYMNLVEQEDQQSPSTKDGLARAHTLFFHAYLTSPQTEDTSTAFSHSVEALKIYLDIGKITSLRQIMFDQGLYWGALAEVGEKRGLSFADKAAVRAGAFLLTSEQIQIEIGVPEPWDWHRRFQRLMERYFSSYLFIEGGRQLLPERLVPYYERALKRRMDPDRFRAYTDLPQSAQHLLESVTQAVKAMDPESVLSNAVQQWIEMASRGEEEELKAAADQHLKDAAKQILEGVENDESVRGLLANVTQDFLELAQQWSAILEQDETLRHKLKEWFLGEANEISSGTEPEDS